MIAIGSDHGGYVLKEKIKEFLREKDIEYKDFGCKTQESCDYPEFAKQVANAVSEKECEKGILVCGSGIGMSMAANKVNGVRAALCHDVNTAKLSRQHNNANILCLGERTTDHNLAIEIVEAWLNTPFSGDERHERRIGKIE